MHRKSITATSPYDLFQDEGQRKQFTKRCLTCALRHPDKHGMPQCDVFYFFLQSILNRTVRWEHDWVKLGKEGPICLLYKEVDPQK